MINKIKWKTNNQNNWNKGTEKKTKAKNQTKLRVKSCSYMKVSHRVSCAWIQYRSTRRSGVVFISLIASSVKHYLSPMKNQEKTQIRRIQSSDKTTAFSKQSKISLNKWMRIHRLKLHNKQNVDQFRYVVVIGKICGRILDGFLLTEITFNRSYIESVLLLSSDYFPPMCVVDRTQNYSKDSNKDYTIDYIRKSV